MEGLGADWSARTPDGDVVMKALLGFLACTSLLVPSVVAQPPTLDALRFLPGDDVLAGAWGDQAPPDIARGGDQFLAVWSDARANEGKNDIYAIRLDSAGDPIGASFTVNQDEGSQTGPRVSWNGQNWLVVFLSNGRLVAVRVAPDGTALDQPPIHVAEPGSDAGLTVASDGSSWAVLWAGRSAGNADLRGTRIAADGTVADPGGVQILPETYFVRSVGPMAFCIDRYFMVWTDDSGVVALRLTRSLQKLDAGPIKIAGGAYFENSPSVAAGASEFYVVWRETDNSYWVNQIKGSRVNLSGVAAVPAGTPLSENVSGGEAPDVAWDGTRWIVAWTGAGVFANRVSSSGAVLDGTGLQVASSTAFYDARAAAVAGAPTGGGKVVWQDYRSHLENDLWGSFVQPAGGVGPDVVVGVSTPSQQSPRVVWNGNGYTMAFLSLTSTRGRVLVQRLDANGVPVDAQPVEVASGPDVVEPGLAWSGSRYLVTWRTRSDWRVHARRLAADLSFQDTAPIAVMTGENVNVSVLGDVFLVVAENSPSYPQWRDVYAQRVDGTTGAKLGSLIGLAGGFAWGSSVGAVGNRWLVGWEAHYSHNESPYTLTAAWVNADGTPGPIVGLVSGSGWGTAGVRVADHPQLGALVYSTTRMPSGGDGEIYLSRVGADGTLLDGYAGLLVTGDVTGAQYAPAIAWNGAEFVTAFQDTRASTPFLLEPRSDIYASRVDAGGVVLDGPGGFPVETTSLVERQPAVAGSGGFAVVASSVMRGAEFGSLRIGVRRLIPADAPLSAVDGLRFLTHSGMEWNGSQDASAFDMLRGDLSALAANGSVSDASCLADDVLGTVHDDTAIPGPGTGFYYLVRADRSGVAPGTYDDLDATRLAHNRDDDVGTEGCAHLP